MESAVYSYLKKVMKKLGYFSLTPWASLLAMLGWAGLACIIWFGGEHTFRAGFTVGVETCLVIRNFGEFLERLCAMFDAKNRALEAELLTKLETLGLGRPKCGS